MTDVKLHEKGRSASVGCQNEATSVSGLVSPRFLPAQPSRFSRRHFRQSGDGMSLEVPRDSSSELVVDIADIPAPEKKAPTGDSEDLDVDIVDITDAPDETAPTSKSHSLSKIDRKLRSLSYRSLKTRRQRKASDAEEPTGDVLNEGGELKIERDRRSTVSSERECNLQRGIPQESPTSTSPNTCSCSSSTEHSDSSQPSQVRPQLHIPITPEMARYEEDDQPSTSRKARQRTLQRSARMSSQEIKSIMGTVDNPSPRVEPKDRTSPRIEPTNPRPSPRVDIINSRPSPRVSKPFLASRIIGSASNIMTLPSPKEIEDDAISPLCGTHGGEPPVSTPTSIAEVALREDAGKNGSKHSFRQDKSRHGHARFFSMSTLKTGKPNSNPDAQKKVSTGPSSPLCGNKSWVSGVPDQRVFNMTLEEVVKEPELCMLFMNYLEHLNASEGLEFLVYLDKLRTHEEEPGVCHPELLEEAAFICEEFIREGSEKELNISGLTRVSIEKKLASTDAASIAKPSVIFQEARIEVYNMLGTNMYSQWLSSLH